jgi:putative transposase
MRVGVESGVVDSILMLEQRHTYVMEKIFMAGVFTTLQRLKDSCLEALTSRFARWTKPLRTSLPLSSLTDLVRSKSELLAENALLRQQLLVLKRQVKRPTFTNTDRILLVLLARLVRTWQQALVIVQPDTLLRWHRELFRQYWKRRSKTSSLYWLLGISVRVISNARNGLPFQISFTCS